jgi:hypothetical protein
VEELSGSSAAMGVLRNPAETPVNDASFGIGALANPCFLGEPFVLGSAERAM